MFKYNQENNWYKVFVDSDAEFIAPALSEEEAFSSVINYCNQNTFLGLDPEMMFPHGLWGVMLDQSDSDMYSKIQQKTNVQPIRLIQDKRSVLETNFEPVVNEVIVNENQLSLLSLIESFEK